ncbi:phosphatidylinositol-binding protein scs2 [Linnemannia hyalina]|uniref:Phosphatidylinositol-binding protein scs2 n=1 Tax=Linnemannia hyalina TaxID=64524 RepID=A0A9P7XRJ3_9FUNG|nr:phosphatidylinositol-binding protein scs2 [Linnemannia hyalina]
MTTTTAPASGSATNNNIAQAASSTTSAILRISPQTFQFTASKVSSGLVSKLKIKNVHATPVGYKFKTNAPLRYSVKPVLGVLAPGQSIEVFVRCESWVNPQDRFLLQSVSLTEPESRHIDAVTWKEIDRRRLVETFIQCSSSSTLSMREPQDDGGSLSSSSNCSSGSSSRTSSTRSAPSRQQLPQGQQQERRPSVAHVHAAAIAAGRRPSASSTTSSTTSSPGSYPTLFTAKTSSAPRSSSQPYSNNSTAQESKGSSSSVSYLATTFSNSRQTIRTVSKFLAIRQYTKMQVLTVSLVCLLLGLLLPLEKLFLMVSGSSSNMGAGAASTTSAQFKSGFIGKKNGGSPFSSGSSASFGALPILVTAQAAAAAAAASARKPVVEAAVFTPPSAVSVPEDGRLAAASGSSVFEEVQPVADVEGAI